MQVEANEGQGLIQQLLRIYRCNNLIVRNLTKLYPSERAMPVLISSQIGYEINLSSTILTNYTKFISDESRRSFRPSMG